MRKSYIIYIFLIVSIAVILSRKSGLNLRSDISSLKTKGEVELSQSFCERTSGLGNGVDIKLNGLSSEFKYKLVEKNDEVVYRMVFKNNTNKDVKYAKLLINRDPKENVVVKVDGIAEGQIFKPGETIMIDLSIKFNNKENISPLNGTIKVSPVFIILNNE